MPGKCYLQKGLNTSIQTVSINIVDPQAQQAYKCDGNVDSADPQCLSGSVKEIHCILDCSSKNESECSGLLPPREEEFLSSTFLLFLLLQLIVTLSVSTVMPLVDAITLESVNKDQNKYGLQRVRKNAREMFA